MSATLRDIQPTTISVGGEDVPVRVRSSAAARTSRILVGPQRPLEIIVPDGTSSSEIDELLASRSDWIATKLAASDKVASRPHTLGLQRDDVVWLGAQAIPVRVENQEAKASARMRDGALVVTGEGKEAQLAVERWYRREARRRALALVEQRTRGQRRKPATVSVRDTRTRWGSCSSKGNLGLSWRLIMAPPEVFEYVVVHELCHLWVPNHSKAFWRQLDGAYPGWRRSAAWLSRHGDELRAYRPRVG